MQFSDGSDGGANEKNFGLRKCSVVMGVRTKILVMGVRTEKTWVCATAVMVVMGW